MRQQILNIVVIDAEKLSEQIKELDDSISLKRNEAGKLLLGPNPIFLQNKTGIR